MASIQIARFTLTLALFAGCSTSSTPVVSKFVNDGKITSYRNDDYGFWIRFPDAFRPVKWSEEGVVVLYRDDSTGANLHIRCETVATSTTLQEIVDDIRDGLKGGGGGKELGMGEIAVEGSEAKWITTEQVESNEKMIAKVYFIKHGQDVVMLFGNADADTFEEYQPKFDASAQSIRFDN
jgi:hypothetical protein